MSVKYTEIGSTLYREIKKRNLNIDDVSKALNIPYSSLHNILHNKAAKLYFERLGALTDFLNIKYITICFISTPSVIKEDFSPYNPDSLLIDLRKVTPETAKLISKLYYDDEKIKNRLGL